mmetsp:Transcript_14956/g.20900  ORF Transcript_14956/g.20900 Transcript_14956/m.20900 type:complete len:338 (+) Transcript_14956:146-1159(+)|eukprot:CAMPEP_0201490482 /NCGR_PEP_ID=MMETSP0151_2-20130828/26581_1 /ASSEMBLY_ACC=CAM_ASM_000257 /TAXON_ID=200890 /ORGANISM="Paramoeba atlantica, Strain 621/1 / CCAP 1560/9" /LENGTH=337 /DNA_ID=CAMNT_0047876455 /DNA_START=91 /DNA_END=1104 /DNA_ORIENTATION=-
MAFLFGSKKGRHPSELVKQTRESLAQLEKAKGNTKNAEKASEVISSNLVQMKVTFTTDPAADGSQEAANVLLTEILANDLILPLLNQLGELEFEAKKDTVSIFNHLLRKQSNGKHPAVEYICKNTAILDELVAGYDEPEIALSCGAMLRDCLRHDSLAKIVLHSDHFWNFFKYVEVSNFDVASDAFSSFKELLTAQKSLAAEFLENNYAKVFDAYTKLLTSENYVTRRQSLKLLGELLLDRSNFNVMTKYIGDEENLKLMMRMLRDKSKSIQFEAFHVFKVFVANPNKADPILGILIKNKEKLISFLNNFHNDKDEEQFNDEKAYLLKQIQALPDSM